MSRIRETQLWAKALVSFRLFLQGGVYRSLNLWDIIKREVSPSLLIEFIFSIRSSKVERDREGKKITWGHCQTKSLSSSRQSNKKTSSVVTENEFVQPKFSIQTCSNWSKQKRTLFLNFSCFENELIEKKWNNLWPLNYAPK